MSLDTKQIANFITATSRRITGTDEDRRRVVTAMVAKAIAYSLPLPGQKVDSFRQWYIQQAEPLAKDLASDINEVVVLDVRMVLELSFQITRARYAVAYDPCATELHKLVDTLVASDDTKSIEGGYRGIFERVVAINWDLRDTTRYLHSQIDDSVNGGVNE